MKTFSLFDGSEKFINLKPIRLIELFGGVQAQATALHELSVEFEHYRYVDFDKYAVKSANAMYGTNFEPLDITKISANDLGVVETENYCYIMTYSFPCTDLSLAGKGAGMQKGSGTRSGLLWEVERLLNECRELPQVLLMENVPQVHGKKNIDSFKEWQSFLESKGYKNYWQDLNAKNYGIPQNRNRTFMVSLLGDYYYNFPQETKLELRLKDMLEDEVDEKYYLSDKVISKLNFNKQNITETIGTDLNSKKSKFREIASTIRARYDCGYENFTPGPTGIIEPKCEVVATLDIPGRFESACRVHGIDGIAPACNTCGGGGLETKIAEPTILQRPHGFNKGAELEHCPSITTSCWESNNFLKEPIIYDDYNQSVKADQTAINTLTTNCGSTAERNGVKIIEPIIVDDIYNNREPREYGDTAPTLRSERQGLKVVEPIPNERFFRQAIETANENECENGDTINAFNKTVDKTGISPTITTRPEGFKTTILPIVNYRVRKLTPKECWRLMGFRDKLFGKAEQVNSNAQLYKQAGNSIVVTVLMAIFGELLDIEWQGKVKKLVESLKEFKAS